MNVITDKIIYNAWGIFISTMRQYKDNSATMDDAFREIQDTAQVLADLLDVDRVELQFRLESQLSTTIEQGMRSCTTTI